MRRKIGECLVAAGLITPDDLRTALAEHKRTGERLGVVLVRLNRVTEKQIATSLASQLGFTYVNLIENPPDPEAIVLIRREIAAERVCVAIRLENDLLTVAMSDPLVFSLIQDLEFQTGYRIKPVVATQGEIVHSLQFGYPDPPSKRVEPRRDEPTAPEAPRDDLVDLVLKSAIDNRASDVHVEPTETGARIRQRIDGVLQDVLELPASARDDVIAHRKALAGMDVAEKRLPQEGRLRSTAEDGADVNFRVSTVRTLFGERIVLRLLDERRRVPPLEALGMSDTALAELRHFLGYERGMILVAGPPGSGKTTTVCAALESIRSEGANIMTIEDPVEYQIDDVNQTQLNAAIDLTFAGALRSVLLHEPDVILVGEIRDSETAKIAMQAAHAGQLVLATLQADDAPSVLTRLRDTGTEPYVIASAMVAVIAQRLVRRLCVSCREQHAPGPDTLLALSIADVDAANFVFYRSVGCDQCNHTGYRGRVGLYEVMHVSDTLRRQIASDATEDQLRAAALSDGMISLGEAGLAKVKDGTTTVEELLRTVPRLREMRPLCSGCGAVVGEDFTACPRCGERLGSDCLHCGRSLQPRWTVCPYCARSADARPAGTRRKEPNARAPHRILPPLNISEFKK